MENNFLMVAVFMGYTMMFLLNMLVTFLAVKLRFAQWSFASFFSAGVISLPCSLILLAQFPADLESVGTYKLWVSALYMFSSLVIFLFWLKAFEPDSYEIVVLKRIRSLELLKIDQRKFALSQDFLNAKKLKSKEDIDRCLIEFKKIKNDKKLIKKHMEIPGLFSRIKLGFKNVVSKSS